MKKSYIAVDSRCGSPRKSCRGKIADELLSLFVYVQRGFFNDMKQSRIPRRCKETMAKIEQKQVVVNEIKEKLERATSVVMVDARGLTVEQDTALRKQLREAGVDYKVYKNTMVHFAIQGTQFEGLDEYLAGPSAFAFSYEDATAGASILNKVAKDVKELEFKAGVVEGIVYDAAGMKLIADIPSREVLLSKLLGSFKSPLSSFARVIDQIAKKDGEAAAE